MAGDKKHNMLAVFEAIRKHKTGIPMVSMRVPGPHSIKIAQEEVTMTRRLEAAVVSLAIMELTGRSEDAMRATVEAWQRLCGQEIKSVIRHLIDDPRPWKQFEEIARELFPKVNDCLLYTSPSPRDS